MKIKKQTLATTHTDLHGEKLSKEELFQLYSSFPQEIVLNDNHDLGRPPIAKASNLTFEQMDDGEWAIFADVAIFDSEGFKDKGGFSMSWLAAEFAMNPDLDPDIVIYFNPRYFKEQEVLSWVNCTNEWATINARELKQKGVESALILIVKFMSGAALAGFFGKAGSDAYDALKGKLTSISEEKSDEGKSLSLNLIVPYHLSGLDAEILLEMPSELIPYFQLGFLDLEGAVTRAKKLPYADSIKKVVMYAAGNPPQWRVRFYVRSDDTVIKI